MKKQKKLFLVYCIDTEGPLNESIGATFERLEQIFGLKIEPNESNLQLLQNQKIDIPNKKEVAKVLGKNLLLYNKNWEEIDSMLNQIMSEKYRHEYKDDRGLGLIYNWHCLDHVGYEANPRERDLGYGKVFKHYLNKITEHNCKDNIHWHFHPIAFNKSAATSATSYSNSMYHLHQILLRRVINHNWFPVVNRAGFHTIRQDSSLFMEQWIPFDYSNQAEFNIIDNQQRDLNEGRFGDWRRAPKEWKPYNPSHNDYQIPGQMNRFSTKCLNIGTRLRLLTDNEIEKAFHLASQEGKAILSFTNHDFRDMRKDIEDIYPRIFKIAEKFKDIEVIHSDAIDAMQKYLYSNDEIDQNSLKMDFRLSERNSESNSIRLEIETLNGKVFGSQPYLAMKSSSGEYLNDNFDEFTSKKSWSYTFDDQTVDFSELESIKVAANDKYGNTEILHVK